MTESAPEAQPQASLAAKLALFVGLLADAGIAVLLIAISGFVFGGPEGANGEFYAVLGWSLAFGAAVLGPAIGLFLWRKRHYSLALLLTWLPPPTLYLVLEAGF